jgi:hypothetical protein
VTVVARFKEYEDWLVESSHKLHGKGKNEALKEEKLAQVSFRVCLLYSLQDQYRYRNCPCDLPDADCTVFTFFANRIVRYLLVTWPDEFIPPGRRVADSSRHHRGRPLSCWCYVGASIVAFHL